ncbi:hypothetical protein [Devosia sp.]|uniref:hypothetical protein n=1 Tax=Devosia sp. TaxID=1871048 RepID=UPI002FCC9237
MNALVFFDAVLFDANADGYLVFEYEAEQKRLPTFPTPVRPTQGATPCPHESRNIGKVGVVQATRCPDAGGRWLYRFTPYLDQTLRRAYELDLFDPAPTRRNIPCTGWRNQHRPRGFLAPRGLIPGLNGDFVEDRSERINLDVPAEFLQLCAELKQLPETVLRGFIADAARLQNFFANPRADGFSSNGSDERSLAYDYLVRAYGVWVGEEAV